MPEVNLKIGPKIYVIDKSGDITEGTIKKFITDKEWLISYEHSIFTTKVTYGQGVYLTRKKAERVVKQIKEHVNKEEEQKKMHEHKTEPEYQRPKICESCGLPIDRIYSKCGCSYDR